MVRISSMVLLPVAASAHFSLTWPPSRASTAGGLVNAGQCYGDAVVGGEAFNNGTCLWFNDGCRIGCTYCSAVGWTPQGLMPGCVAEWGQPMKPTLPEKYRSYADFGPDPSLYSNPWMAPGYAPVDSPCGVAGGHWTQHGELGNSPPRGLSYGFDQRYLPTTVVTDWKAGSVQEVAVDVSANHGGGYAFRLCPKDTALLFDLPTEACFQKHHLPFAGDVQWLQRGADKSTRQEIPAMRVSEGTSPAGSQWTRFPIPACGGSLGGDAAGGSDVDGRMQGGAECNRSQFEPPVSGLYGFGLCQCLWPSFEEQVATESPGHPDARHCRPEEVDQVRSFWNLNVIDLVQVPSDLPPGDYVMSWRHDCEQSAQIWSSCADIRIIPSDEIV